MTDVADSFDGQIDIVRRTRGYRRWPDDVKARIVAESFQPGVRVADVARRHGLASHQLSDWRRQARQGLLALPAEMIKGVVEDGGAAFVPVMALGHDGPQKAHDDQFQCIGGDLTSQLPESRPKGFLGRLTVFCCGHRFHNSHAGEIGGAQAAWLRATAWRRGKRSDGARMFKLA